MDKSIQIFLVDDDIDDRFFFELALSQTQIPYRFTHFTDGQRLLDFLKRSDELPFVIFLDLNMPRKNGTECLVDLKKNEKLKNIPVVIYSTLHNEDIASIHYSKGAHFYVQKPDFKELPYILNKVLEMLSKNKSQPPRDKFVVGKYFQKNKYL